MPTKTKTPPITLLITISMSFTLLNTLLIRFILNAKSNANIITGIEVPKENPNERNMGMLELIARGINIPKNITPLYGQKANAKNAPKRKDPK